MSGKDDESELTFTPELHDWWREQTDKFLKEKAEETAHLPKPTHYPHLEPQTVYGIVLHDPNLRIIPAGFPERKLH